MKVQQLKKDGQSIVPITHTSAVIDSNGHSAQYHFDKTENAIQAEGVYAERTSINYEPSLYWVGATPKVGRRTSNQFSTKPFYVNQGEKIHINCACDGRLALLAKLTSDEESLEMTANRLMIGTAQFEALDYLYTASESMWVKVTCYDTFPLSIEIERKNKIADNKIDYLENKISESSAVKENYERDFGEVLDYQKIGQTDYAVIMMYGQSLSIGQETPASFIDAPVEDCYMLAPDVHTTEGAKLIPLGNGLPIKDGIGSHRQDSVISATKAFVNLYRRAHPEDKKTKFIAVSLGVGGRSLITFAESSRYPWYTGEHYFDTRVKSCLTALKNIADEEGKTISICSLIWCQGETDYSALYIGKTHEEWYALQPSDFGGCLDAYKHGLRDLYSDITTAAQSIFGKENQVSQPPFFAYALGGSWIGNAFLTINHATYELAEELPTMWIVGPNYPVPDYRSGHLAMNGYRWYGEYIAKAMYYALIKGVDWKPLQPLSVEIVDGNKIEVTFDRDVTIDTWTNDEDPDYGFVVRQGTAEQLNSAKGTGATEYNVDITSITTNAKKVVIQCADSLNADCVEVIYAGAANDYANNHFKGSGNVRDNDKWLSLYKYGDDTGDHGNAITSNWEGVAYDETAEDIDPTIIEGAGYSVGDVVNIDNIGFAHGRQTVKSLVDNNTKYPYQPVDYKPLDENGQSIVGKKYPMQNWCINFYKRIVQ